MRRRREAIAAAHSEYRVRRIAAHVIHLRDQHDAGAEDRNAEQDGGVREARTCRAAPGAGERVGSPRARRRAGQGGGCAASPASWRRRSSSPRSRSGPRREWRASWRGRASGRLCSSSARMAASPAGVTQPASRQRARSRSTTLPVVPHETETAPRLNAVYSLHGILPRSVASRARLGQRKRGHQRPYRCPH